MRQQMAVPGACSLAAEALCPLSRMNPCHTLEQVFLSDGSLHYERGLAERSSHSPKVFSPLFLSQDNKVTVQV